MPKKTAKRSRKVSTRKQYKKTRPKLLVYGRVHALWCGHCLAMNSDWTKLNHLMNRHNVKQFDIESADIGPKTAQFKQMFGKDIQSQGYPTIFKLHERGDVEYYNGPRTKDAMHKWLLNPVNPVNPVQTGFLF